MDFIVLEFINLIKRCSNGLALEKEIWRRGIELQCQAFAQALETYDAEMARQYAGKQEVLRIDPRTVLCMFGTVTFSRRLVRREGEKPFYPLDNILGLSPYQRYSPLLLYSVTKVAASSVYRAATEAVNTLTPLDISHQTVGRIVKTVGDKYAQYGRGGGPSARMVVGASATADTSQDRQTTMECTDKSKASGLAVSVAVSLESVTVPPPRYSVLSGPHAPTTGQARSPAPAGRTWPPALLVLCAGIRRFFGSREGRPRRSRRDNIGCCRSWGGARGRWGSASWSVAAAFDRQGKAIGCEPPARDERVCPPGGEPSRVYGYRSFCPLGGRDGFACGETPTSSTSKQR